MGKPWVEGGPSGDELRRIQRGIDECLRQTVAHRPYSPGSMPASETVKVVGAPTVVGRAERGWIDSQPLTTPLTGHAERVAGALVDQAFPPGPAEKLARLKAELGALSEAQREQLLREIEASKDPEALEVKALALEVWK